MIQKFEEFINEAVKDVVVTTVLSDNTNAPMSFTNTYGVNMQRYDFDAKDFFEEFSNEIPEDQQAIFNKLYDKEGDTFNYLTFYNGNAKNGKLVIGIGSTRSSKDNNSEYPMFAEFESPNTIGTFIKLNFSSWISYIKKYCK